MLGHSSKGMKTNQIMSRKMGEFSVEQRTKDSMFNATKLLKQWNEYAGQKKVIAHFFENINTKEFIKTLENDENLKDRNSVYLKTRGKNGGTWMHPYLFIDFAMWLNPKFKLNVIKFVYDELIENRHLAGDNYVGLCRTLHKFPDTNYGELGKIINYVVFNKHSKMIRNLATAQQLQDIHQLERDIVKYVDMGFVNSFAEVKAVLRREWRKRHTSYPKILQ
jgi:hypothetical protein